MKTKFLFIALMGVAMVACAPKAEVAENEDPTKPTPIEYSAPTKAEINEVSYLLGVNFGSFVKNNGFGEELNYSAIVKGIKDFMKAEGNMYSEEFPKQFKYDPNTMNRIFPDFIEKVRAGKAQENAKASEEFLKKNAKAEGVKQTESGLQYIIIEQGNEVVPTAEDTVWVNYKGSLLDGTVFDECPEGAEPIQFTLGQVIPGWTEGMTFIGEGGKIKLFIPSDLAYGEQGAGGSIGPNCALVFEVSLSKVGKVQK